MYIYIFLFVNKNINSIYMNICPICRYTLNIPIKLSCNHVYCYLCIKSTNEISNNCPYCSKTIDIQLDKVTIKKQNLDIFNMKNLWLYSDKEFVNKKWWLYDPVTNILIENLYNEYILDDNKDVIFPISIAIKHYTIDFKNMKQISGDNIKNITRVSLQEANKLNILGITNIYYTKKL